DPRVGGRERPTREEAHRPRDLVGGERAQQIGREGHLGEPAARGLEAPAEDGELGEAHEPSLTRGSCSGSLGSRPHHSSEVSMSTRPEDLPGGEPTMDPTSLYREDIYTDRKVGALRMLTPVTTDGSRDLARPILYVGEAQLLTTVGAL